MIDTGLASVSEAGDALRARWDALQDQRGALREAILAGRGAGLEPAAIARCAAVGHFRVPGGGTLRAITRQGVHKILAEDSGRVPAAWEAAGRPDQNAATDALAAAALSTVEAIHDHRVHRGQAAEAMWRAAGLTACAPPVDRPGPAAIVAASGLAGETGYAMLGLGRDWAEVRNLLGGLVRERDEGGDLPVLGLSHDGRHIQVNVFWGDDDVQRRMEAALAQGCWEITDDPASQWVPIRRNTVL